MSEPASLAAFQAAFLEVLAEADDPAEARRRLAELPEARAHTEWIASFEDRGLETGMELVRQWGARRWRSAEGEMMAHVLEADRRLVERARPLPEPGPGQVRLAVEACGVCGTDVHLVEGRFDVPLPVVPGHEVVGVVEALGAGVTGVATGDRVGIPWMQAGCGACAACDAGRPRFCRRQRNWITQGGGFAEAMIVEAAGCVPLPDALAFEHAAPLFCAGFTAISGFRRAAPRPGDRVAVLGFGGLGHLAVQIARAHGHEVVVLSRGPTKTRDALALGASEVIAIGDHAGRALAAAGGADVILSTTSDLEATGAAVHGLRDQGRLALIGLDHEGRGLRVDPMSLIAREASIVGAMQRERSDLVDLLDLAARGLVRPRLELYRGSQLRRALARLADGRVRYRAVLRMR